MGFAALADIHSNIFAIKAVLADIEKRGVQRIICAGDLVGYAPFPNEVIDLVREMGIETVMGNYDEGVGFELPVCGCDFKDERAAELGGISNFWTQDHTTTENKRFLQTLPREMTFVEHGYKVLVVHGSPRQLNEYLHAHLSDEMLLEAIGDVQYDILICGHTHKPYHRLLGGKHIINVGSVGKPKHGEPAAVYALLDLSQGVSVNFVKVDYKYEATAQAILEAGLPVEFAQLLREGRG